MIAIEDLVVTDSQMRSSILVKNLGGQGFVIEDLYCEFRSAEKAGSAKDGRYTAAAPSRDALRRKRQFSVSRALRVPANDRVLQSGGSFVAKLSVDLDDVYFEIMAQVGAPLFERTWQGIDANAVVKAFSENGEPLLAECPISMGIRRR